MNENFDEVAVIHNEEAHRFEATVNGLRAILAYRLHPGKIFIDHTEVPPPLQRKGLAAKLTRTALDFARANQLRVVPQCPYVAAYVGRHVEFQDLVSPDELLSILRSNKASTS